MLRVHRERYSAIRSIEGSGFRAHPTASFVRDSTSSIEIGQGSSIGRHVYICALDGGTLEIENYVDINEFNNIRAAGGSIFIGAKTIIAQYVSIIASNHIIPPPGEAIRDAGTEESRRGVRIGRGVWIAANAVILPGVEIGDGAVIGAGTIVSKSVPANAVVVGNPGRVIRYR
jgi:acetyltransferase-like isoleucine patch superfamily enzyme